MNRGRKVYRDPSTQKLYSVDTQHGEFEVLNSNGNHENVINFWGQENPNKIDTSGRHNLRTK